MSTTITVNKRIKRLLEEAKASFEQKLGRRLTWNEFLEITLGILGIESILELDDKEAKIIMELTVESRKSWKRTM